MDAVKQVVRAHWGRRAAEFDRGATHGILTDEQGAAWRSLLKDVLGEGAKDVLDVGCGTGFLALLAAKLGHRAVGVDLAPEMVALAREKAQRVATGATFLEGDVETLDFQAGRFDVVIERHVLWTLPAPVQALREWRRLLRGGGEVVLIEGHWGERRQRDEYDGIKDRLPLYGGRPAREVMAAVRAAGFGDVTVREMMEPALWGGEAGCERYMVRGRG
ncbi:MAG TPA: class I SAM-dependent methyltransferase [Phycisphaerae bacterium]|nr:class I SAM-dependent methyltransferase [Phycisphaerae bacterium]